MKPITVAAIVILICFGMNNSLRAENTHNTQKSHIFGEKIYFSKAGFLKSWDDMTYKINISWQTTQSDIIYINIYVKEDHEEEYHLIKKVPYENGSQNLYVEPEKDQQYVLTSIDKSLAESEHSKELRVTTGWRKVSPDISEIVFINNVSGSDISEHREFAKKTLTPFISAEERKKILMIGANSDDLVIRAFSLLGLGYVRGWNKYMTVFEKNISNDDSIVRWAAISSLYFPKGPIERPFMKRKKEDKCKILYELSRDESQIVRAKISFLLKHLQCTESN